MIKQKLIEALLKEDISEQLKTAIRFELQTCFLSCKQCGIPYLPKPKQTEFCSRRCCDNFMHKTWRQRKMAQAVLLHPEKIMDTWQRAMNEAA